MPGEMWPKADLKHFRHQKNIFSGSRESIWGPKRPISVSYKLNLGAFLAKNDILRSILDAELPYEPIFLVGAIENFA